VPTVPLVLCSLALIPSVSMRGDWGDCTDRDGTRGTLMVSLSGSSLVSGVVSHSGSSWVIHCSRAVGISVWEAECSMCFLVLIASIREWGDCTDCDGARAQLLSLGGNIVRVVPCLFREGGVMHRCIGRFV
jgi:hypothetical protein